MRLDENRRPVPTGEFETLEADSVILALGQDTDTTFLRNVPGIEFKKRRHRRRRARHADRLPGRVRRRRHGAVRADGHHGGRTRQEGRAHIDAWLRVAASRRRRRSTRSQRSRCCGSGITPRRAARPEHDRPRARRHTFDEVVGGLDRRRRATRRSAASPAATASSATAATRRAPSRRSSSWVPGRRYEYDLDKCTGCAICYDQCPCGAITMIPEPVDDGTADDGGFAGHDVLSMAKRQDPRRQRGRSLDRLPRQRGLRDLSRSRPPRRWASWRISGRPRARRTSGARCRTSSRCRARAAPPARCTARCRPAR